MFLQETYEVLDCKRYIENMQNAITINTDYGDRYTLEFETIKIANQSGTATILRLNTSTSYVGIGWNSSANSKITLFERRRGTETNQEQLTPEMPLNTWIPIKVTVNGTSITMTVNNIDYTLNNVQVPMNIIYDIYYNQRAYFKNIRIY